MAVGVVLDCIDATPGSSITTFHYSIPVVSSQSAASMVETVLSPTGIQESNISPPTSRIDNESARHLTRCCSVSTPWCQTADMLGELTH